MKWTTKTPGAYRTASVVKKLPARLGRHFKSGILRLAIAENKIEGVTKRPDLAQEIASLLEQAGVSEYPEGLRSGAVVPIVLPFDINSGRDFVTEDFELRDTEFLVEKGKEVAV